MRINENNNSINKPPAEQNSTQTENKENNLSLFNILNKEEKATIDKNQDGKISFEEVKNYINSNIADSKILNKLASILGIEVKTPVELSSNTEFKKSANALLDAMDKIDANNDEEISLQEIKTAQNLTKTESVKLHKVFGLTDGEFQNQQGQYGSCWALAGAYGIYITDKEKFNKIIKQDEDGNTIVTFYGAPLEPFETQIDRRVIQKILQLRTKTVNYNIQNQTTGNYSNHKYYSSDPEAIAIELAFTNYDNYINHLKQTQAEKITEYVKNSTPIAPQKPDLKTISLNMSNEDLINFLNYYRNSTCENKDTYIFPYDVNYLTPKIIEDMKKYIENSTPTPPQKPSDQDINYNITNKISNYLNNSISETTSKPQLVSYINTSGTIEDGGQAAPAIRLMAGGTIKTYKKEKFNPDTRQYEEINSSEKNEIANLLKNFKKNNQVFSISFTEPDSQVYANHAYTIINSDDKNIYLINPHDTEAKPVIYSIKNAIKNLKILQINTLPQNLPT